MQLSKLELTNFRSCTHSIVEFPEPLTVLIGENGSGKSNIIDSIRLSTEPASGRRSYYFDSIRDLSWHRDNDLDTLITIDQDFSSLNELEKAFYTPQLVDRDDHLRLSVCYAADDAVPVRFRRTQFIGTHRIEDPEPANRSRIAHIYLPPLRDAVRDIDSPDGNRIVEVMQLLAQTGETTHEIEDFEETGRVALSALESAALTLKTRDAIQQHIKPLTVPVREQCVTVDARPAEFRRLARSLRIRMLEAGMDPHETTSNTAGLGYASLLYIATIIVELSRSREFDLTLLLIEEPEAHLHPQLLTVLLDYMKEQIATINGRTRTGDEMASGNIQVIVSTHSPVLTSSVSTTNIVAVTNRKNGDKLCTFASMIGRSMDQTPKVIENRRKVDRFLNATRSAMLFSRQVILVEGIAEAILIKTLAEKCVFPIERDLLEENNATRRNQFRAISVVGIDGVGFVPYLEILLCHDQPIAERVVVVTDADGEAGEKRREDLLDQFGNHVAEGRLHVHVGDSTFESDLIAHNPKSQVLKKSFVELHSDSGDKWDEALTDAFSKSDGLAEIGRSIQTSLVNGLRSKGEFAQALAAHLDRGSESDTFEVPPYLVSAIKSAVIEPVRVSTEPAQEIQHG